MPQLELNVFLACHCTPSWPLYPVSRTEAGGWSSRTREKRESSSWLRLWYVELRSKYKNYVSETVPNEDGEACLLGSLEEVGAVSPGERKVVMVNVGDEGIGVLLVHMPARANRGQTSPNFPV